MNFKQKIFNQQQEPAMTQKTPPASVLASEAVEQHCRQAAEHMRSVGAEIMAQAASANQECCILADNIEKIGELEKIRTSSVYTNIRETVQAAQLIRNKFDEAYESANEAIRMAQRPSQGADVGEIAASAVADALNTIPGETRQ